MNGRFLLYGLIFLLIRVASLPALTLPRVPLGFERNGPGFSAQTSGATVQVDVRGLSLTTAAGSVAIQAEHPNPRASLSGQGTAGTRNTFIGRDPRGWTAGVPLFENVRISALYPGIDLVCHGLDSHLEYDLHLAPGADPSRIVLLLKGARSVALDAGGNLAIGLAGGQIVQKRPAAYQIVSGRRRTVESRFLLTGSRVRFALGPYDRSRPLIIDPVVAYSGYLGGASTDEGHAVAVDAQGNLFIAGRTFSTTGSNSHVLLLKVAASGAVVQSVFGGVAGNDSANALAVDSSGNVYLAGSTSSADFPIGGAYIYQGELLGTMNAFVMAFNPALSAIVFSTFLGGSYTDEALGIALGPNNNVYVVGDTASVNFSAISNNAFQVSSHGGLDAFLVSLTNTGALNFGTYLGGSGDEHAYGVAVDSAGASYVVGATTSSDYPASPYPGFPEPFQLTNHGNGDGFAIKFFPDGSGAEWSTFLGGENGDAANAVALDAAGQIYIAGTTGSQQFPVTPGALQTKYQGGGSDGFVLVLNNNGQSGVWGTFVGSDGADTINGIALDSSNDIVLTGTTDSLKFPVTADAVQSKNGGGQDVILATLNNAGTALLFSTYFGGSGNDVGTGVAVDSSGHIFLTGITASSNNDFPVTTGARQPRFGGGSSDAFFAVFGCSATTPAIGAGGVVNAASDLASAISPGGVISIFGTNLGCTPAAASAVPLPMSLGSVSVQVNGKAIPLFYVSETQINAQLPYETPTGTATLVVTGPGGTSAAASVPVVPAGPGIFLVNKQAAALNADGTLNTPAHPAKIGSYISVFLTGQGPVSAKVTTGAAAPAAPPYVNATSAVSASIGSASAMVYFLGLAPGLVGLAQANLLVPNLPTGNYPLVVTVGGLASAPATVSVTQ